MSYGQELKDNLTKYIDLIKHLTPSGKKYTVINPYSAFVIGHNGKKFTFEMYYVTDEDRMIHKSPTIEYDDINVDEVIDRWLDLDNHNKSFPFNSNFIDAPFETFEIFNAIRMINIQLLRVACSIHGDYDRTITNIFPTCMYSEINFKPHSKENQVKVQIKVVKNKTKLINVGDLAGDEFERELTIDYTEDNVEKLYNTFMSIYWEYDKIKNV